MSMHAACQPHNPRVRHTAQRRSYVVTAATDDGTPRTATSTAETTDTTTTEAVDTPQDAAAAVAEATSNGASTSTSSDASSSTPSHLEWVPDVDSLGQLTYNAPSGSDKFWTSVKLAFALPWRRFKKESVLTMKVGVA
jgi:protease-4